MQYVKLGRTGLEVSRICLGCMSYGDPNRGDHAWTLDEERSRPLIRRALEAGVNFFDTANTYSDGTSEEYLGRAIRDFTTRDEVVIDVEDKSCPCCNGTMHQIGETRTEMLDIVPAQLRVKVIRRPRYACRACEEAVVQAPAPERPIDGGMATEALVAHVLISKFLDYLPLYRQSQMLARQGIDIDRSTLGDWVGRACWWLRPVYDLLVSTVMSSTKLFADDTTLPVLDPGRGKTKTGRLWCYAVDDRPW